MAGILIDFFKADPKYGVTLIGGCQWWWRKEKEKEWAKVFRRFDIISPWSVGRYGDIAGADGFRQNLIVPDLAAAASYGREYMPVIFPGFSWFNLNGGPLKRQN